MNKIIYKGHEFKIIKYYTYDEKNTIYNLYKCINCNFSGWNLDLNIIDNGVISCNDNIIKSIIE